MSARLKWTLGLPAALIGIVVGIYLLVRWAVWALQAGTWGWLPLLVVLVLGLAAFGWHVSGQR